MTALPSALSLSNKLLEVGTLVAFTALLGIAVLSLLVFSQARELKRLREWAGRAPERAAELEQRVSAEAAARVQRVVPPVPRATPVLARTVGAQPPATAVTASGRPATAIPDPSAPPPPGQSAPAPPGRPASTVEPIATPVPGQPAFVPTAQSAPPAGQAKTGAVGEQPKDGDPATPGSPPVPVAGPAAPLQPATAAGVARTVEDQKPAQDPEAAEIVPPIPSTTAVKNTPRQAPDSSNDAQEEPAVAEGAPRGIAPATAAAAAAAAPSAVATRAVGATPRAPVPPVPARSIGGATGASGGGPAAAPRPPLPPSPQVSRRPVAPASMRPATARPAGGAGFKFLQEEERSPRKATALIVGGVVVGVAVLAVVLLSLGGGSTQSPARSTSRGHGQGANHTPGRSASPVSPAETHVVVLNATEANGLAHRLAGKLQQSGYTQAAALSARPPSGRSASVVEFASGHRSEAQHVGQTLGIGEVAPLEGAIASVVGGASVVVIAGADQAALAGSGNPSPPSQSSSEAASSGGSAGAGEAQAGGEAAAGTGQ